MEICLRIWRVRIGFRRNAYLGYSVLDAIGTILINSKNLYSTFHFKRSTRIGAFHDHAPMLIRISYYRIGIQNLSVTLPHFLGKTVRYGIRYYPAWLVYIYIIAFVFKFCYAICWSYEPV